MRDLVTRAIQDRSKLIGHALAPVLRTVEPGNDATLNAELAKFASDGTVLKLMLQPSSPTGEAQQDAGFFFVASAPSIRADEVAPELDELSRRGILKRLSDACMGDASEELRYRQPNGTVELLTSIIPIKTVRGCWVLTSTHTTSEFLNTSIGRPYWETRAVRVAAGIYLVLAILAVLAAVSIFLSLRRFREVADEIGQGRIGDYAFSQRNIVPELSSVARDFDKLVLDLKHLSQEIRQSAEDNAHSFKTPLAAIQSSLSPVRRSVPLEDQRARRALEIIDSSLARLLALVNAAQRFDNSTVDLIEAPRVPTNLTQLVGEATLAVREIMAGRDIRLIRRLDDAVIVRSAKGMFETVLQNVLENAISFSPRGATIIITLTQDHETVELQVDDEGPGIPTDKIERIFERYFSSRPNQPTEAGKPPHSGLGLWIVRRNVEALGGEVRASNRIGGGLSIAIVLPRNGD
ncbi:MAG: sensor histidine kinase [Reyranella sp.]|uniref:sensor histidine kinase n=1 Tax=Reyranella sp. TaxID=1929291 RepID=UPI001AC04F01|nr:ATP-binding protein [Reyranella sp.]MBN9088379.1 sensor histidine kinase [Reyranella sp.]